KIPGVGRKTANVILAVLFHEPTLAVDTHVFRVARRLGLVTQNAKTPLEVEKQLIRHLPTESVSKADQWIILHGRYICVARTPKCKTCDITHLCRYYEKKYLAGQ
ncbi:MAG: endonuclease III, partial [Bacteroidota bacterium]